MHSAVVDYDVQDVVLNVFGTGYASDSSRTGNADAQDWTVDGESGGPGSLVAEVRAEESGVYFLAKHRG